MISTGKIIVDVSIVTPFQVARKLEQRKGLVAKIHKYMQNLERVRKVANFVRNEMDWLCVAHDFQHIEKVVSNAKKIARGEGLQDTFIIEIAAYLHETLDEKFFPNESLCERKNEIEKMLLELWLTKQQVKEILFTIENVGYSKSLERDASFVGNKIFEIVEDADRLEAIGATAIARCFSYGAKIGRPIYDPDIYPFLITDTISYKKSNQESTSLNHFYEKLLLLKDMMHTATGKQLAEPRHNFMQLYVDTFLGEWKGGK